MTTDSNVLQTNLSTATLSNSGIYNSDSRDSKALQTEVATSVREAAAAARQIFTPLQKELKAEPSPSTSSSALSIPTTVPLPVLGSSATVGPTVVSAGMDIETLFLSSPLLTPEDRTTIKQFFSEKWSDLFSPSFRAANPVLKIKLRSDEKVDVR